MYIRSVQELRGRAEFVPSGFIGPAGAYSCMNPSDVEELIREALPDARVRVRRARGEHDDDHLTALVVSPAFDGETLVAQHERVYDALDEHMTTDIHALELKTYTPEAFEEADLSLEDTA
jgi:stress-induced morphogen